MALPRSLSERLLSMFSQGPSGEVIVNANLSGSGKTYNTAVIGMSATNLSGATAFVASAGKKFYITHISLANASLTGLAFLSGVTYLLGNASVRMTLTAPNSYRENGSPSSPLFVGLANATDFKIVADTASPIAGKIIYYEE